MWSGCYYLRHCCSHLCTNGGLSISCYNFSEEVDWDIPLHHFMIPKCALYIQEQVLRESERQLVVVYAYMQILPLPPFKSLNRIYTQSFCCDCSHPETKPKTTYIKLGVIAFRQHKWREGKKHKILRNFDRRGWKWYICLLPPVPYLFYCLYFAMQYVTFVPDAMWQISNFWEEFLFNENPLEAFFCHVFVSCCHGR